MNKLSIYAERVWLAIALASFIFWGYKYYMTSWPESRYFLYIGVFALVWFLVRQGVRKNFERKQKERDNQK